MSSIPHTQGAATAWNDYFARFGRPVGKTGKGDIFVGVGRAEILDDDDRGVLVRVVAGSGVARGQVRRDDVYASEAELVWL